MKQKLCHDGPWFWAILLGVLSCTSGCDTHVDPVRGTDQPFSLFGLFSPEMDTQRVLVFPIEDQLRL